MPQADTGTSNGTAFPLTVIIASIVIIALAIVLRALYMPVPTQAGAAGGGHHSPPTSENPQIADCISRCKDMLNVGADLSSGLCIVADLNGYGCAVASKGKSPCHTAGSSPQILLNDSCELIKVVE